MRKSVKWALGIGAVIVVLIAIGKKDESPNTPEGWKQISLDPRGAAFAQVLLAQDLAFYLDGGKSTEFWKSRVPLGERISSRKFYSIYHANEISADERFKGKPVVITGAIGGINKDAFGNAYLALDGGGMFSTVHANLADETEAMAGRFAKGNNVTLFCVGGTMIIGFPVVEKCQSRDAMVNVNSRQAGDAIRTVMTGDSSGMDAKERQFIALLYLTGTVLPEGSACETATVSNFDDCEKDLSKNNPMNSQEVKDKYSELQKKLDLPSLTIGAGK
ncbi:MAG: hypothetical protein RH863_11170 [Parvibaculum sp.]